MARSLVIQLETAAFRQLQITLEPFLSQEHRIFMGFQALRYPMNYKFSEKAVVIFFRIE